MFATQAGISYNATITSEVIAVYYVNMERKLITIAVYWDVMPCGSC
jgi:cytidine deaminase